VLESLLITLREGFEAALIVAIVLTYLRRSGRTDGVRAAWAGVGAAIVTSVVLGVGLRVLFDGLEGVARLRAFAAIAFGAAAVLTWMIFWMRKQSRGLKGELEEQIGTALTTGSMIAVAGVTFLAVVREGLETALFLLAATTGATSAQVVVGAVAGLVLAVGLAVLVYLGGRRIPMRTFFTATGVLLIVFAAGLLARGVMFLQASGDLGSLNMAVYDLTSIDLLTVHTQTGRFLAGIFGWDPRPSLEQLALYLAYLVPVTVAFTVSDRLRLPTGARRHAHA
jgi:high-affinity iron transporter